MLSLAILSFALSSYALPTGVHRSAASASWCSGLGGGSFDTAYNFTLAAYNTSSSNTNSTGVPLVLGENGSTETAESKVLSTFATYPYNDWPNFSLINGALVPNPGSNTSGMYSSDMSVASGDEPTFLVSGTQSGLPFAAQVYCAVADTDPDQGPEDPVLAVNSETDQFSLCMSGSGALAQNNIVYRATSDNAGPYDYDSCYPVVLHLVGLD